MKFQKSVQYKKIVDVPEIRYIDKMVDVPKITVVEKIIEIPRVEHRDVYEDTEYIGIDLGTITRREEPEIEQAREMGEPMDPLTSSVYHAWDTSFQRPSVTLPALPHEFDTSRNQFDLGISQSRQSTSAPIRQSLINSNYSLMNTIQPTTS